MGKSLIKLCIAIVLAGSMVMSLVGCKGGAGADGVAGVPGAAGPDGTNAVDKGTISGTVKDAAGNPIANATVAATPGTATASTSAAGAFTLSNVSIGVYTLTATATGYAGSLAGVGVVAGSITSASIVVSATPTAQTVIFSVKDTAGTAVAGATVYAITAADVASIATQSITLGTDGMYTTAARNVDEPLEDLINGNYTPAGGGVSTYKSAVSDASGKAVISNLAAGTTDKYFIYVKPATADADHLPGGSLCRNAVSGASLNNTQTAIKVSTRQSASAMYIGSSTCLVCHASYGTEKQTLHKLGIMVPKSPSNLQDVSKFQGATDDENFYAGLNKFEAGTTVHYYTSSVTATTSAFKTLASAPTGTITEYFTLTLSKVGGAYKVQFNNIKTPGDPNSGMIHDVVLTYGGGLHKQRYMTKIGNSIYVLPLQYNPQGSDTSADSGRTVWAEYNTVSIGWWDATNNVFTLPTAAKKYKSFDVFCAGCHFTGYSVTENAAGEFLSSAVTDANGEQHPTNPYQRQEMNIGCESCHGPGSEHADAGGNGMYIVTPKNLTPEREAMICGSCHTRGDSKGTAGTHGTVEALLDVNMKQMKPGTSRADFLVNNTTRNDASSADGMWADGKHSKKHHQQYTDFIQTKKYRNGTALKTCANCHDVHAPGTDKHQLSGTSNNSLCISCHATVEVVAHMTAKTGTSMGTSTLCIECHATKTAKSGSGSPTPGMTGASGTKYYQNDISSHRLDVPLKTSISSTNAMPIPYTSGCGSCHSNSGL